MKIQAPHTFHIPVMGLGYTIDSPVKVARYGITAVVSIIEDHLVEQMREVICKRENIAYVKIDVTDIDHRSKRITAYLNLMQQVVDSQMKKIRSEDFSDGSDINKYFEMLPEKSELKKLYQTMLAADKEQKKNLQEELKKLMVAGDIDVNIMTKCDKANYDVNGNELPSEYSDALAALKGYAESNLESAIIFSAGMNPRLFGYCEKFKDFYPDANGYIKKKIILKVSDYRSAIIQGKYLAKKGLWVSEYRIESGINCGGHAFVSSGLLLGPILEDFKNKRTELLDEVYLECSNALKQSGRFAFKDKPSLKITAQGGIGTAAENDFLLEYYNLDATGWGSPFLLVPEVTNVDEDTLQKLVVAKKEDYYISHASPLGIPFSNFRNSSSEGQRKERIVKHKPGSPCYKEFLAINKEFTEKVICTASRQYQKLKIEELTRTIKDEAKLKQEIADVTEKDCLCEGLGASALIKNHAPLSHNLSAVTICPGPNLAYFSGVFSLKQMVDHIYGRLNLLNNLNRPYLFINELQLYVDYIKKDLEKNLAELTAKKASYFQSFKNNLMEGIGYYETLFQKIKASDTEFQKNNLKLLDNIKDTINQMIIPLNPQPIKVV